MQRDKRLVITGLMCAGLLCLQAAWILVTPPFGGTDEFDHAYRASAAAHGEIFTTLGRPEDGRGLLVTVNDGIAEAAQPQCEALNYTGRDNCHTVSDAGDGMVTIASAAAIYQPTYYVVVGWVSHLVDGYAALYGMRLVSALICAALWGLAVWVITGWARSMWPLIGATAVLTPTTLYGLSIVAPNGLEMVLAIALWACLIGYFRCQSQDDRHRLLVLAIPLASVFAWIRPLSPIWLFLILTSWIVLLGWRGSRDCVREHGRVIGVAAAVIGTSALTSALWVLTHPSGEPPVSFDIEGTRWGETIDQVPTWFFQVISAVPFRNDQATLDVYLAGVMVLTFMLLPLFRCRTPRVRASAFVIVLGALAVGIWYTYSRLPTAGPLWQGRYAWCLALGVVLLAGLALEDRRLQVYKTVGLLFCVPALVVMHLRCLEFVWRVETANSPLTDSQWVSGPLVGVLALALIGLALWVLGVLVTRKDTSFPRGQVSALTSKRLSEHESTFEGRTQ